MRYIVEQLGISSKVKFYGHVSDTENWHQNIDIFISNSYSEGLQVVPMEAMASGCYCVVHRWNGAEELVPEEHLYYTNSELRKMILNYYELPDLEKEKQRSKIRTWAVKYFDIEETKLQVQQVIEEIYESTSRKP